jgi:glycosyltransferase involved in cell wall biosynthesis
VSIGSAPWLAAQALVDRILLVARALEPEVLPSMRPRARVLYNGVNVDLPILDRGAARAAIASALGGTLALEEGTKLFVSLSSPTPFKGLHYLIEAAAIAKARGVRAAYVLAGEPKPGGYQAWLARRIGELGLGGTVALVGFVEDTHRLLCAADALVLPSVEHERIDAGGEVFEDRSNEGLPRSILEAMVAGIPAIASDIAGVSEQIDDGRNGLMVPPKDAARLADAIERMAKDDAFRARAGVEAHATARARFRLEDAAKGLVRNLTEVAAEPSGLAHKMARWPALTRDALRAG